MLGYLDAKNALFTRGITFDLKEYIFALQVALGEDAPTAYAMVYDRENFVRETGTDDEQDYIQKFKKDADIMLQQQECRHLLDYLKDSYQSDVQQAASSLKDYKFSGGDVQQLLANLLHNRVGDGDSLDDASIKDVISLIKMMYEQGALDSGDSFQKHFIQIHPPFNALCPACGHEFEAHEGLGVRCPHCGQDFNWSENEKRFYPKIEKLWLRFFVAKT